MKKTPRVFEISWSANNTPTHSGQFLPGSEWVGAGEGVATVKLDGTACLVEGGQLFARYDAKHGKTPPADFRPAQPDPDPVSGHWPGWVPVTDDPKFKHHREAFSAAGGGLEDGTYELLGPKVQGNPYGLTAHVLERHGARVVQAPDRSLEGLMALVQAIQPAEGIVFHHPDGRMAKVTAEEFGIPWKPKRRG